MELPAKSVTSDSIVAVYSVPWSNIFAGLNTILELFSVKLIVPSIILSFESLMLNVPLCMVLISIGSLNFT